MNAAPLFSVLVPAYNGGPLLNDCLKSVLSQTFGDFELLLLDNRSTDGSIEAACALEDERIHVLSSPTVLSIEKNWDRIRHIERAQFMTILGADDLLDPHFLAVMADLIRESPAAGLFHAHFRLIDADGALIRSCLPIPAQEDAASFLRARLQRRRDSFGTGYVMRSADYDRVGGIPPFPGLLFADDALWLRLLGLGGKVTAAEECFSYRLHSGSASGSAGALSILTALARYLIVIDELANSDQKVAIVARKYLGGFMEEEVRSWYLGQLAGASHHGHLGISRREARGVLRALDPRLERTFTKMRQRDARALAHEFVNAVPALRFLYRSYKAERR